MISKIRAQNIASEWYAGDGSGLYLIVCGRWDKIPTEGYRQALAETRDLLAAFPDPTVYSSSKKDKEDIEKLARFLAYKIAKP